MILVALGLPLLKIIQTFRKCPPTLTKEVTMEETVEVTKVIAKQAKVDPSSTKDVIKEVTKKEKTDPSLTKMVTKEVAKDPSLREIRKLGVADPKDWTYIDQVGYGLLRRFDDISYWLLIGLLLANRYIFQLRPKEAWTSNPPHPGAAALAGALFVLCYLGAAWVEKGTIFSYDKSPLCVYLGIQIPEGILNAGTFFVSGAFFVAYCSFVKRISTPPHQAGPGGPTPLGPPGPHARNTPQRAPLSKEIVERVRIIGYTPFFVATIFSAAVEFMHVQLDSPERMSLVIVLLCATGGGYLFVLGIAKWRIPEI
jgi:hypothetical protein